MPAGHRRVSPRECGGGQHPGETLRGILTNSTAHVIAMTGCYFRGERYRSSVPKTRPTSVMSPTTITSSSTAMSTSKPWASATTSTRGVPTAIDEMLDTDEEDHRPYPQSTPAKHQGQVRRGRHISCEDRDRVTPGLRYRLVHFGYARRPRTEGGRPRRGRTPATRTIVEYLRR